MYQYNLQWKAVDSPSKRACLTVDPPLVALFNGEVWYIEKFGQGIATPSFHHLDSALSEIIADYLGDGSQPNPG